MQANAAPRDRRPPGCGKDYPIEFPASGGNCRSRSPLACFATIRFVYPVLLGEQETLNRILESVRSIGIEKISLQEGSNRIVEEDIRATIALPGFDNSTVDGY